MYKIFNIKAFWDRNYDCISDNSNMLEGKILLYDDNWFEGLVVDPKNSSNAEEFVFGIYYPDKVLHLYKYSSIADDLNLFFQMKKDVCEYTGEVKSKIQSEEKTIGFSIISTQCSELIKDSADLETNDFFCRIKNYINLKMSQNVLFHYQLFYSYRDLICEIDLGQNDEMKNL